MDPADPSLLETCTGTFNVVEQAHVYNKFVTVEFLDLATFAETAGGPSAVKEVVENLGDAAYFGPAVGAEPYLLAFRKGDRAFAVSSLAKDESGNRVVTNETLREVADVIASRLQ